MQVQHEFDFKAAVYFANLKVLPLNCAQYIYLYDSLWLKGVESIWIQVFKPLFHLI